MDLLDFLLQRSFKLFDFLIFRLCTGCMLFQNNKRYMIIYVCGKRTPKGIWSSMTAGRENQKVYDHLCLREEKTKRSMIIYVWGKRKPKGIWSSMSAGRENQKVYDHLCLREEKTKRSMIIYVWGKRKPKGIWSSMSEVVVFSSLRHRWSYTLWFSLPADIDDHIPFGVLFPQT
jgi:hypothetical protein